MGLAIMTRPTQTHAAPTELGSAFGGGRGYKHGAPNEACPLDCPLDLTPLALRGIRIG